MKLRRRVTEAATGYLLVLPGLSVVAVFAFYPLVKTVWIGFHVTPPFPTVPSRFVGVSQFGSVLGSSTFVQSLWRTVVFALISVPGGLVIGTGMALLGHQRLRGIQVFRTAFSSTVATSVAVASVIFVELLNPQIGLLSYWLGIKGGSGVLDSTTWALPSVAFVSIWQGIGFTFVLMSAALNAVPDDLLEAAAVDGAGPWMRLRRVTLPMLSPVLLFAFVVGMISSFQAYAQFDLLAPGGKPLDHTLVLVYWLYEEAFVENNPGVAAVISTALFVILLVLTALQFRLLRRRVFYAN